MSVAGLALVNLYLLLFFVEFVADHGTHQAANDMGQVGYVVCYKQSLENLLSQIDQGYQNEGQGNLPGSKVGEGGQDDKGENNTAGTAKAYVPEQEVIHKSGDQSRQNDDLYKCSGSILFLQHGTQQEQVGSVAHEVRPAAMPKHMGEKPQIGQRILQRAVVGHKQGLR